MDDKLKDDVQTHSNNTASTASNSSGSVNMISLAPIWKHAQKDYEFMQLIGVGAYGEVV